MFLALFSSSSTLAHASFICFHSFYHHSVQPLPPHFDLSFKHHTCISKYYTSSFGCVAFLFTFVWFDKLNFLWHLNHYLCPHKEIIKCIQKIAIIHCLLSLTQLIASLSKWFPKLDTKENSQQSTSHII